RSALARSRDRYGPTVLSKGRQEGADHRFRSSRKAYLQGQSSRLPLQLRQLAISVAFAATHRLPDLAGSVLLRANADPIEIGFPFQILQAVEHLPHIVGAAMAGAAQKIFPPPTLFEGVVPPAPQRPPPPAEPPGAAYAAPGPP